MSYVYFDIEQRGAIALVWLDDPEDKMNTLKVAMMEELGQVLDQLEAQEPLDAVVLASRKPKCFIAGADINMFGNYPESEEAKARAREAHQLARRLGNFKVPTVAAVRGVALGGGLEIAMACNYRVAANDKSTFFGVPEVKLGLLPGLGGTQRLPALVGLRQSLDLLLTGKNLYPRKAKKIGLVDALSHAPGLVEAAVQFAATKANKGEQRKRKRALLDAFLESPLGQNIIFDSAKKTVMKQTAGNYPAPFKILDCVREGWNKGLDAGIAREIDRFDELVRSPESQSLVSLFFGMNESKKNPDADKVMPVHEMGVLGAGLMGSGICEVSAPKGYHVILKDISPESLGRGEKAVYDALHKKVKRKIMTPFERDRIMANISGTLDDAALAKCDIVIEAVFESLELKRKILADIEAVTPDHCIFASNTSSIPIGQIAEGCRRPERVIGMHYFSPVAKMPLLEIIVTDQTAEEVTATAVDVGIKQGKNVIVVGDGPGFYTTRILAPMLNEAVILLEEGASIEDVDKAMFQFGFPVGPITLMDEVGIDVGAHVGDVFAGMLADRDVEPSTSIKKIYEAGYHGRKNGRGFYRYDGPKKGKKQVNQEIYNFFGGPNRRSLPYEEIQQRLSLCMINEAAFCLQENILRSPGDGDLGAILGLGFPPFLGGPFRYLDSYGTDKMLAVFDKWTSEKGARFKPAQLLQDYKNKKFHS